MYLPFPKRAEAEARGRHPRDAKRRAAFLAGALYGYKERTEPVCGILFHDGTGREPTRPVSLEEVRDAVAKCPGLVVIEDVSRDGTGFQGELLAMPRGRIEFVGPNPWTDRQFRGWLIRDDEGIRVEGITTWRSDAPKPQSKRTRNGPRKPRR